MEKLRQALRNIEVSERVAMAAADAESAAAARVLDAREQLEIFRREQQAALAHAKTSPFCLGRQQRLDVASSRALQQELALASAVRRLATAGTGARDAQSGLGRARRAACALVTKKEHGQ